VLLEEKIMKVRTAVAALALAAGMTSFAMADITGKVNLDGKAPEAKDIDMSAVKECAAQHPDPVQEQTVVADDKGNLANVIVSIKKEEGKDLPGEAAKDPVVLDQKGCMYEPHVLAVMAGQPFKVKNDDPFLHNVHSLATTNPPFNFGQPNKDEGKDIPEPLKAAEYFRVKCDVHPWMSAYIGVFEHPFFAVTKPDGTYTIKTAGLPDGDYTLNFWHEKFASDTPQEEKVTIKDGKAEVNHTFKAEAAAAETPKDAKVILASDSKKAEGACPACSGAAPKLEKVASSK
jgi:plastocyanin